MVIRFGMLRISLGSQFYNRLLVHRYQIFVCFDPLQIAVSLRFYNSYVRERFSHPRNERFVPFFKRCGISLS